MENNNKLTLYQKLIEIRKGCAYLQKENAGYQYTFVSSSQTLSALRSKMDELGVLLMPKIVAHNVREFKNNKDSLEFMTELDIEYTWLNAENPSEFIISPFYGQGVDNAEKGVGKALTYAEKYFFLKFFQIATDKDDPDAFQQKTENKLKSPKKAPTIDPATGLYKPQGTRRTKTGELPEMPDYLKEPVPKPEDESKRARETAAEVFEGEVVEPQKTIPILDEDEATRIKLHALLQSRNGGRETYPTLCAASKEVLKQCTVFKDLKLIDRLDWLKGGRLGAAYGNAKKKYPAPKEDDLFPMPK
jgi:hypothetical protein